MRITTILYIFFSLHFYEVKSQTLSPSDMAMYQANQCASEIFLYQKFSKSEDNRFNCILQNNKKKEYFYYESKDLFRYCEYKDHMLNGMYKVNFRNGKPYLISTYENYLPKDSAMFYYASGELKTKVVYSSKNSFIVYHYYLNGVLKMKAICNDKIEPMNDSNVFNSNKNGELFYYNLQGNAITKEEYLILNPNDEK